MRCAAPHTILKVPKNPGLDGIQSRLLRLCAKAIFDKSILLIEPKLQEFCISNVTEGGPGGAGF